MWAHFCWLPPVCSMERNVQRIGDFQNEFREMFPEVEVVDGSIITEEHRIYSNGGANSCWNLLLHLVEKYTDRRTAILASKYFAIDIDRDRSHGGRSNLLMSRHCEKPVISFFFHKSHGDEAISSCRVIARNQ